MKKSQLFLLLALLTCIKSISAQELSLYVKKGNALVGQSKYKDGAIVMLKPNETAQVETGSLVILKGENMIAEVKPGKYNYKELKKLLPAKRTFTESFINAATNQHITIKRSAGVVTRGNNDDPWAYSPADSLYILSDSLRLKAGNEPLRLLSEIKLFALAGNDTLYLSANKLVHQLKTPPTGQYCWVYEAKYGTTRRPYKNYFVVPSTNQKQQKLNAFIEFKNGLDGFSVEMQELLREEYMLENNLYIE
jgi:hypothetical protein